MLAKFACYGEANFLLSGAPGKEFQQSPGDDEGQQGCAQHGKPASQPIGGRQRNANAGGEGDISGHASGAFGQQCQPCHWEHPARNLSHMVFPSRDATTSACRLLRGVVTACRFHGRVTVICSRSCWCWMKMRPSRCLANKACQHRQNIGSHTGRGNGPRPW